MWMPHSPGNAVCDSALDFFTSGVGGFGIARGIAAGTSMPSPAATPAASLADTLTNEDSMRWRMAGTVSLLSSKRNAAMMWATLASMASAAHANKLFPVHDLSQQSGTADSFPAIIAPHPGHCHLCPVTSCAVGPSPKSSQSS